MKEIDFLPEWYKSGKRRRVSYRRQFLVIGGLLVTLLTWSFAASYSIRMVEGQVDIMQSSLDSHKSIAAKYDQYNRVMALLEERFKRLEDIDPDISVPAVMAELSYIASDNIMMTNIDLGSEKGMKGIEGLNPAAIRLSAPKDNKNAAMPSLNVRYKLTIDGVAADAAAVTNLITELERSSYFTLVVPGLLEHIKDATATRFQISCYIANYKVQ